MSISLEAVRGHFDYSAWATNRVLDAAARLTEEELHRDFKTADRSVLGTLGHVYASDRAWLARVTGTGSGSPLTPAEREFAALDANWRDLQRQWREWAAGLREGDPEKLILYKDFKGNQWEQPLWQIVLHVINHGTHHRGAVSGFLRSMGHAPPPLDLIAFYRGLN